MWVETFLEVIPQSDRINKIKVNMIVLMKGDVWHSAGWIFFK